MKLWTYSLVLLLVVAAGGAFRLSAQEVDGSDLNREVRDRQARIEKLSIEDQLRLRAAEQKAAEDPEVKAALEKRNQAIAEFRATLRATMIKVDPAIAPLLEKVAIGVDRRP